jgi:HK97 family phage major capsid protein
MTPAPTLPRLGELTRDQYQKSLANDYAKYLGCLGETNSPTMATSMFLDRFPQTMGATFVRKSMDALHRKAAVSPGMSNDATWAGPLAPIEVMEGQFVALARSLSLVGRVPGIRRVPFNVHVPLQTSPANYQWVSEGAPKPVSNMAFVNGPILTPTKHAGIVVLSMEFLRLAAMGLESALRDELLDGLTQFTDDQLVNPAIAAVPGKNPASLTNGTTPIPATASYETDVKTLLKAFYAGRPNAAAPVLVANADHANDLRVMNLGAGPGLPVLVSAAALGNTIAIDGSGVFLADDGVKIRTSSEATLQMNDAPDNPVVAATVQVSLWQMNCVGYEVERLANWQAQTGAVRYLAG